MPRIEIIPETGHKPTGVWTGWRAGGSPAMDVCHVCIKEFELGPVPDFLRAKFGANARIATLDCEHPSYDKVDYDCEHCGMSLLPEDN
jgi:hypothetical protein